MSGHNVEDPQFWRWRAEEVRTIADDMKVDRAKAIMERIAADYERIAQIVEQQLREGTPLKAGPPKGRNGIKENKR